MVSSRRIQNLFSPGPLAPTCPAAVGCWGCRVRQFIARKAPDGCLIA